MEDYRRHDAPDQNRPKEILSPYAKTAMGLAYGIVIIGMITHGLWGIMAALGAIGMIATSSPKWISNSAIERQESQWITRRLQAHYDREIKRAEYEQELKIKHESPPSKFERIWTEAGCLCLILLVISIPVTIILGLLGIGVPILTNDGSNSSHGSISDLIVLCIIMLLIWPWLRRFNRAQELQNLADEPRGGIKTQTLRDFAEYMEAWPYRDIVFVLSGVIAAITSFLMV